MCQKTYMRTTSLVLLVIFAFYTSGCQAAQQCKADNSAVKITDLGDRLKVEINGKLFTEYRYKNVAQPHFYPIVGQKISPTYPQYWDVKDGKSEIYLRCN